MVLVIEFLIISIGAVQNRNVAKLVIYWKMTQGSKKRESDLRACPEIGYEFALIRNCKSKDALKIADIILNSTATLILL